MGFAGQKSIMPQNGVGRNRKRIEFVGAQCVAPVGDPPDDTQQVRALCCGFSPHPPSLLPNALKMGLGVALFMLLLFTFAPVHAQDELALLPDEPQTVTLTAEAPVVLHYEAAGGEVIQITTEAQGDDESRPDTVLALIAPDDTQMAYNDNTRADDDSLNTDAQLQNIRLPVAGIYRIVLDSFNGVSEGVMDVTLSLVDPFAVQVEERDRGQEIRFTLPADSVFSYSFTVEAESRWTLTARDSAGALDPYMRLLDESGDVLASNDDHASPNLALDVFDAQLRDWQTPQDGTYTVQISDVLGRPGDIVLTILQTE
jgi:hypothetical protein